MSRKDKVGFMIRLNLKNEEDRQAWELLQDRGELSYKQMFVQAILSHEHPVRGPDPGPGDREDLRRIIREEVRSVLREELGRLPAGNIVQPMANEEEASDPESMDEARDFMKLMGF